MWVEEKVVIVACAMDVVATALFYDPVFRQEANPAVAWVLANLGVAGFLALSFLVAPTLFFIFRRVYEFVGAPRVGATVILGAGAYIHFVYGAWSWVGVFFK
jgi:hypothetical protein